MQLPHTKREITRADDLSDLTLVIIGLWNMGYTDLGTVARLLWLNDRKPLQRMFRMLKTIKNPLIRRYVDVGLPRGVWRALPLPPGPSDATVPFTTVRCKLCGRIVRCVPCPACSMKSPRAFDFTHLGYGLLTNSYDPNLPQHSTSAEPGSLRKIAVFRERVLRGEQVFHPDDSSLPRKVRCEPRQGSRS